MVAAEHTGRATLLQNDHSVADVDLHTVTIDDAQVVTEFFGDHEPPQIVDAPHNADCPHSPTPVTGICTIYIAAVPAISMETW